jgi:hypothetical protein
MELENSLPCSQESATLRSDQIYTIASSFFKTHFNSVLDLLNGPFASGFESEILYYFMNSPTCITFRQSQAFWFGRTKYDILRTLQS